MKSTEVILTFDYPFRRIDRQYFGENRHCDSSNRSFQPQIGTLAPFASPEMTTFGNDTAAFSGNDGLMDVPHTRGRIAPGTGSLPGAVRTNMYYGQMNSLKRCIRHERI